MGVWIETKHLQQIMLLTKVTPFVGVWIETAHSGYVAPVRTSHPSWVCGLKHPVTIFLNSVNKVTPFVGVWIETKHLQQIMLLTKVTPFVGVWIETLAVWV